MPNHLEMSGHPARRRKGAWDSHARTQTERESPTHGARANVSRRIDFGQ